MSILYIDPTDFSGCIYGSGGKAIAASALRILGSKIWLVGVTSDPKHLIGKWNTLRIADVTYNFMPLVHTSKFNSMISLNIQFSLLLAKYWKEVNKSGIKSILTRCSAVLWFLSLLSSSHDICFFYPGVNNPMRAGRKHKIGWLLAPLYDTIQARAIRSAKVVLAAADRISIGQTEDILKKYGTTINIHYMPTAVNTSIFSPKNKVSSRRKFGFNEQATIFVFVGRLAKVKGIDLLIRSLWEFNRSFHDAILIILGEGEERNSLEQLVVKLDLRQRVYILGNKPPNEVADYIGCADCCVIGSHAEGFSNAMVEEIACGRPLVSTNVSGAMDLIEEGQNGYIVTERDPVVFSRRMYMALNLNNADVISRNLAISKYSEEHLWKSIGDAWEPMAKLL